MKKLNILIYILLVIGLVSFSLTAFRKIWPWTRIHGKVSWAAIYNNDPEVWVGIIPFNRTNSL